MIVTRLIPVLPDLIRHAASSSAAAEGSWTPDQVRGHGGIEMSTGFGSLNVTH